MLNNIELIIHSSLRIKYEDKIIYIDPYMLNHKYENDADYIFITHNHYDHFSSDDIIKIKKSDTKIIIPFDLKIEEKRIILFYKAIVYASIIAVLWLFIFYYKERCDNPRIFQFKFNKCINGIYT